VVYVFEDYELDLPRYELRHAGKPVRIEPQVFNLLVYLVQHRDRVVTKEELLERLWAGRFVSETTLTSRLTLARRAIGDRRREPHLIQTIHGRGYRFIAPVEERPAAASGRLAPLNQSPPSRPSAPQGGSASSRADAPATNRDMQRTPAASSRRRPGHTVAQSVRRGSTVISAVGRQGELEQFHRWFRQALGGTPKVVFVTGEPGLGKTTLVEAFLQDLNDYGALWVGRGQCIEHNGAGEAYLPVLEALGGLCKEPDGQELTNLLVKHAPTWVVQMPWLVSDAELDALQRRIMGTTRERMLREVAAAIVACSAGRPMILALEDLHWCDHSTVDLISWVARLQEPARLFVLGTYRPAEVRLQNHPLQAATRELMMHRRCEELALTSLTQEAVEEYLRSRFASAALPAGLANLVYRRTEGNPLFMVSIVDAWDALGWLEGEETHRLQVGLEELAQEVPESLRQMLAQQLDRLSPEEQRVLEAASAAGLEFSAATVAASLDVDVIAAEAWCEELVRRHQWLRAMGPEEWPDGTLAGRYAFGHALYHDVVYQQLAAARRAQLHRRIGAQKEAAYGTRAGEIAAELATHFEYGRDYQRAIRYLQRAAEVAGQRYAHREMIEYLRRALALLRAMPAAPELTRRELEIHLALGPALMVTRGFAAAEVSDTYAQARQLCERLGDQQQLFAILFGQWRCAHVRAQLPAARALGEQLLSLAQTQGDPTRLVEAHAALGQTLCIQGELAPAREHLRQVVALYEPERHDALSLHLGYDPGVYARAVEAWVLWLQGYAEQALRRSQEALTLAQEQGHPFTLALTHATVAVLHQMRQDGARTLEQAGASLTLAHDYGFPYLRTIAALRQGWAFGNMGRLQEGIALLRQNLDTLLATGSELLRPYHLALLAEICGQAGQIEAGLSALEEALLAAHRHTERFYEAELFRLKGELLLRRSMAGGETSGSQGDATSGGPHGQLSPPTEAEACFQAALATARGQGAKALELRAALSLCRLWNRQGRGEAARRLLAEVYGWFTEGFETADLREAKQFLEGFA
jgi:predicted ATPase/DNA-binding winged helix-turn-helix (wHTH) protein